MIDSTHARRTCFFIACALPLACADDSSGDGNGETADTQDATDEVGTFDGLFDELASGLNFGLDLAIVPHEPDHGDGDGDATGDGDGDPLSGDLFVANYGTSEVLLIPDPSGKTSSTSAQPFFDGTSEGLLGTTSVSIPPDGTLWATFEQGGEGGKGGVVALSQDGEVLARLDAGTHPEAIDHPSGICFGAVDDEAHQAMFIINYGDGSAWRLDASDGQGTDAVFTRVGSGLATAELGSPGSPGNPISSNQTPVGGARGCAFHAGHLYVADAQNARVVRFDDALEGVDIEGTALEDTPSELVTHPTGVAVNADGALLVISSDNAHAFVALELPTGNFIDNGIHDLNVNAGNYGMALASDTIWFLRANNTNGTLRAVTPDQQTPPNTNSPFPAQ